MISFAFVDANGVPTSSGRNRFLPDGAVELPGSLSALDLAEFVLIGDRWVRRPLLPKLVETSTGFTVSELPARATVTVMDIGTGEEVQHQPREDGGFTLDLPSNGSWSVSIKNPPFWVGSTVNITRGSGSSILAIQNLSAARKAAIRRTNTVIGDIRDRYHTQITGQSEIYLEKRQEAIAYIRQRATTGEPATLADYPFMEQELGVTANTAYQIAQVWLFMSSQFKQIGSISEGVRTRVNDQISKAKTEEEISALELAFQETISALPF